MLRLRFKARAVTLASHAFLAASFRSSAVLLRAVSAPPRLPSEAAAGSGFGLDVLIFHKPTAALKISQLNSALAFLPASRQPLSAMASAPATSCPQSVNREAVKVLAMAVGIREAARRMGLSEERVMKWSQRDPDGPWTAQLAAAHATTPSAVSSKQASAVRSASTAMADTLGDLSKRGRLAYLSAGVRVGEKLAQTDADELLVMSADAKAWASTTALAGSWPEKQATASVMISVEMLGVRPGEYAQVIDVEASTVQDSTAKEQL